MAIPVAVVAGDDPPATTKPPAAHPSEPAATRHQPVVSASPALERSYQPTPFRPADHDWLSAIPAGVRINQRLPEPEDALTDDGVAMRTCGAELFPARGVLDRRTVSSFGPEYGEARDLRVFADDRAAHRFVVLVGGAFAACPQQVMGGTLWRHRLQPSLTGGEESLTAVQTFENGGHEVPGANWWEAVRVGNAVLLTGTGGEYFPGRPLDRAIAGHARKVWPIVRSLCGFSADGCATGIPDGFPLAEGYPDDDEAEGPGYGRQGPSRTLAPVQFRACGRMLPDTNHTDRLIGRWTNVEDFRTRQLTVFPDAGTATARVAEITGFYRSCPTENEQRPYAQVTEVRRTAEGGESWAVVRRQEYDGHPAVGLEILHVIRFGRAVLVDITASEAGAGPDPEADVRRQLDAQTVATAGAVAAMCAFTEAGCP